MRGLGPVGTMKMRTRQEGTAERRRTQEPGRSKWEDMMLCFTKEGLAYSFPRRRSRLVLLLLVRGGLGAQAEEPRLRGGEDDDDDPTRALQQGLPPRRELIQRRSGDRLVDPKLALSRRPLIGWELWRINIL